MKLDKGTILYTRKSRSRINGVVTTFSIVSIKTQGRYWYSSKVADNDRLIVIRLTSNGTSLNYPYTEDEPSKLWEAMANVWVYQSKKQYYLDKIKSFITKMQDKLDAEK